MDYKDHIAGVGAIITNLQAMESAIRRFLVEKYGQCAKFPEFGDKEACKNYLTAFVSLRSLIIDYERVLEQSEQKYAIDSSIILIRDAFAHGRLISRGDPPNPPFELWKFGDVKNGKRQVDFCELLTSEWLKEKWLLIDAQRQKVVDCSKARGYRGLI